MITLSIELLPAPLGPMIARISCSRTSKLMSDSAFTPPNDSEMLSSFRTGSPIRAPTLATSLFNSAAALPPEGELFAPWDGPAALICFVVMFTPP